MKRIGCLILLFFVLSSAASARTRIYQKGTVTRMRMGQCMAASGRLVAALSGQPHVMSDATCPEYTLFSERVVYVVVAKSSHDLIPLAEGIDFRFQKNEMLVRVDDSTREVRLSVRAMWLREDWEREELERQRNRAASTVAHGESLR